MKNYLWHVSSAVCIASFFGCNSSTPNSSTTPLPAGQQSSEPSPIRADARARSGNVEVEVGRPGEKPAVGVDVRPGGNVDVNVDRDKIRERIDERRAERKEPLP